MLKTEALRAWDAWWAERARQGTVRQDVPMSTCTTLKLGGPADRLLEASEETETADAIALARRLEIPVTVIGAGSNLLVLDGGIRGLTVRIGRAMSCMEFRDNTVTVQAGTMLTALSREAAQHALDGLVFACGIPGTVGGGVTMNAGAYGGEMSQVVTGARVMDTEGRIRTMRAEELCFAYRSSALQKSGDIVTQVMFRLESGDPAVMMERMRSLREQRQLKQPLDVPSAGSTFRRPEGAYASALIDQCGLKGCRVGMAQVSEKHAGFLINRGTSAHDFLMLMRKVRDTVREQTGYVLEPEVRILGENLPGQEQAGV